MKAEQQRIKIAEACGWKRLWQNQGGAILFKTKPQGHCWEVWFDPSGRTLNGQGDNVFPPDYLNDLDAIHDVEIYLSKQTNSDGGSRMPWYRHNLYNVCLDAKSPFCNPEHATAVQRAEALLKTLNLWEES